jgi:hypothetical protein
MRHHNFTAFDEYIVNAMGFSNAVRTSTELNARLAHFDQLAIMAVVDNINQSDTFNLIIEHSSDGRNFTAWNTSSVDLTMGSLVVNQNNVGYCSVPTATIATPLLSYVRFAMYFTTSATTKGHIRITVTQRDQGS